MDNSDLYPIEQYFMTKNRCYIANKRRKPTGIQVHSVGCKGTNRDRWRRWNNASYEKCPNAFIDTNGIMQCLDWDVRPWLSGSGKNGNANNWCIGFEICEPSVKKDTEVTAAYLYGCVRWLCFELCKEYGIDPLQIKCHCELHREGAASNHADVNHWWGKKGTAWEQYTMTRLRSDVADMLKEAGLLPEDPAMDDPAALPVLRKGNSSIYVQMLQKTLNALGFYCGEADGIFGSKTVSAVKGFQKAYKLSVDGIVGVKTWTKLLEEKGDD